MVNKKILKIVAAYVDVLKASGISFTKVILFGSYARGAARQFSDIDVAVFSKKFGKDCIQEGFTLMKLARPVDLRIEPVPLPSKDFTSGINPLVTEIKKYGIPVG
jgi:predicted nucleotidyltransferase